MITEQQYKEAIEAKKAADVTITAYLNQTALAFSERWKLFEGGGHPFNHDQLTYSATVRCGCGAGLAYPRNCGSGHHWTCAALLTEAPDSAAKEHSPNLPFMLWDIKSELQPSAQGQTTRPL